MEGKIFYGIINSKMEVIDLSLDKKTLREIREDEAVFTYDVESRMTSISVKTGSKFQISKHYDEATKIHKAVEAAVKSFQSQKIPINIPIVEIRRNKV